MTPVEQITSLYIGYFGRAPDPAGLNYWVGRFNDGFSLSDIAESFSVQPEATTKYPYLANQNIASPQAFITQVYLNLFNRTPDAAGLAYWTAQLAAGADVGDFILDVISGATTAPDSTIVANKVSVGVDFALMTASQPGFTYNAAAAGAAVEVINGVDATAASVTAGKAETAAFIAGGSVGATFAFTTNIDALAGTGGNDLFVGDYGVANSVTAADSVTGGAGTDTLNLFGAATNPTLPQLNSVENLNFNAPAAVFAANVAAQTGVQAVGLVNTATSASTFTINADQNVSYSGVTGGNAQTVVTTAADTAVTVNVAGSTLGAVDVQGAGVTTLNVASNGSAASTLASLGSSTGTEATVNISGTQGLTVTAALDSSVKTVNASTNTGGVNVTLGAADVAATGGSGADTFAFGATLTTADTVVGGNGVDVISITGADIRVPVANGVLPALNTKVTGVETLAFTGATAALISGQTFTNTEITKLLFNTVDAATDTVDFAGSARTYAFGVDNTGAATLNGTAGVTTVNLALEGTAAAAADVGALTVNFTNNTATQVGTGTINIASTGANGAGGANTTGAIIGQSNGGALTSTNVVVTGSHDLTIGSLGSAGSINASAFTGKLNVVGSSGQDTIIGGSGADTINATVGADTYTGGAGADSFVFTSIAQGSSNALTTISDFVSGTDKLNVNGINGAGTAFTATAINVNAAPDFAGALNLASNAAAAGTTSYFQFGGNTFVVVDNNAALSSFDAGTDAVIRLTGVVNLTAADVIVA
jgi:hypothetical protein